MKEILLVFLLIASYPINAEDSYIEIGITDVGSWNSVPAGALVGLEGLPFPDFVDDSNRNRKFVSFHKKLDDDFYLLGSHTETKSIPPSIFNHTDILEEKVSTLGVGYGYSLKNYDLYVELSAYRYTKSYNALAYGWLLGHSEIISMGSALKRNESMYRLGLIKELSPDVDIDISYGSYQNITLDNSRHRNKSIKLIKDFDDRFSLVLNYEKDGDGQSFRRTSRSLSLRTKF
ncbi:hypothetical protein HOE22_11675 [Candidatus Woesearchaeota archaeon]|nr:hypothetical protein [Candidatus Woesearchaeota archaeon]